MWELSNKDPVIVSKLENLTEQQLAEIPEIGDGNAVFMGQGTQEEYEELQKEDSGMSGWYKRLKNL